MFSSGTEFANKFRRIKIEVWFLLVIKEIYYCSQLSHLFVYSDFPKYAYAIPIQKYADHNIHDWISRYDAIFRL
jgi:hypothetical protein